MDGLIDTAARRVVQESTIAPSAPKRDSAARSPAGRSPDSARSSAWNSPAAAWTVMLIALALRVFAAVRFPFEQDELYTLAESRDLFHTTLAPGIDSRPVYYLMQHAILAVLPPSAFALRLLPLVFGALGLLITWRIGRRYLGPAGGLIILVLAALSPWHLYASSMARYYALVYVCAALVVLWLPDAYSLDRPRGYLAVLGALIVGTLTHPSFMIAMAGLVVGFTLVRADARLGWRWPTANAWRYLWGPYAAALVAEVAILRLAGRSHAMVNMGSRGLAATIRLVPAMVDWMTVPVLVAAVIGAVVLAARRDDVRRIGVMTIATVIGTCLLLLAASMRTGVYADYGIGMLPLLFLCVAALAEAVALGERTAGALVIVALVVGSGAPSIVSFLSDGLRFDYRPAYAEVATRDPAGVVLGWPEILRKYYGAGLRGYELRPDTTYLNGVLQREQQVWAVVSAKRYGIVEDNSGELARWLTQRCRLENSFTHPRFDYRVYRVDLYRCQSG